MDDKPREGQRERMRVKRPKVKVRQGLQPTKKGPSLPTDPLMFVDDLVYGAEVTGARVGANTAPTTATPAARAISM